MFQNSVYVDIGTEVNLQTNKNKDYCKIKLQFEGRSYKEDR